MNEKAIFLKKRAFFFLPSWQWSGAGGEWVGGVGVGVEDNAAVSRLVGVME